ncbi:hypothetical protein Rsub_07088 [Raphidocelis subcapitata]|uniref:Uncharacterized protein n=1 Tax=Raphidocelis subcapitata TaxID=307507 RepID=A0A2V0P2J7_9CHLO|nr:hypothetical protein Rsub_07088 [Raphidocelis subcapitata]|eukprot:GBF94101.1 hypothetical protein Rsub_07088 [Raphidocelis subcapitata]
MAAERWPRPLLTAEKRLEACQMVDYRSQQQEEQAQPGQHGRPDKIGTVEVEAEQARMQDLRAASDQQGRAGEAEAAVQDFSKMGVLTGGGQQAGAPRGKDAAGAVPAARDASDAAALSKDQLANNSAGGGGGDPALDAGNFDAGVRGEGASTLERPLGAPGAGERDPGDPSDDYARATVNDSRAAGGLPGEAARIGLSAGTVGPKPPGVGAGTVSNLSPGEVEARATKIAGAEQPAPQHGRR